MTADRFAQVAGERVHYLEAGAADAPPLLLLHTGGASAHEFEAAIPLLADSWRVIAWDMPGHGDSDAIHAHRSIPDYADALAGLLDALALPRATIVGASIGGYIAMDFARRFPARVNHLVLAESPLRSPEWYAENWPMFEAMCAIPAPPFEAVAPRFAALTQAHYRRFVIDRLKAGSWTTVDIAWAVRDFDAAGAVAGLTAPTTVLMGADGPTAPEQERWRAVLPDARITILAGCGHFVMVDDPAAFAAALPPPSQFARAA